MIKVPYVIWMYVKNASHVGNIHDLA